MIFEAAIKNKCFYIHFFFQAECWKELEEKDQQENKEALFSLCSAEDELGITVFHQLLSSLLIFPFDFSRLCRSPFAEATGISFLVVESSLLP